jgi:tetratricopeptide (TPR) repeat protein
LVIAALVLVAQLSIVAHAPDSAAACEAIELTVAVNAPGQVTPQITAPALSPFDILRSSSVPHVTYDARPQPNGSVVAEFRYVITTDRVGTFTIPAFEARLGSSVVRSQAVQIVVRPTSSRGNIPTVVARARIDTSLEVNFQALALPETVFVGQQANYEVAVFLNETVRDRLRRNPTFFPPDMQSMLAYDLTTRGEAPRRRVGSRCFDALVYQRALFPLMPGRFAIPPAQLVYSLPLSASFFSREETHELQTDSSVIVAVEPPRAGRPADYGGAVGDLRVAARLDTSTRRVGDPVLLTVRVMGTGNVKLFPRPSVSIPWATLVNGDERVQIDSTSRRIGGSKEFDWVLTPRIAGELDLPPIRYSYFNPEARRYAVATTAPTRVRITAGTLASADTARTESVMALRARYRGAPGTPPHQTPLFWGLLAALPIPVVTLGVRERRRRVAPAARRPADRLTSLARLSGEMPDACAVRRAFAEALADRLGLRPDSFTRPGALARSLRRRGVSTQAATDAEQYLRVLDEAAFASSGSLPADAATRALAFYRVIDAEALSRIDLGISSTLVLVAMISGAAVVGALQVNSAQSDFDRGVAAYQRHEFVAARDAFAKAVVADPAAPDAWANLGTAAWASADTGRSVAAWQRALRLEPLASDMRDRVELVHAIPVGAAGYVPPLPPAWLFDAAALLWCLAWGIAAVHLLRKRDFDRRALAFTAVAALVLAIAGFALAERTDGARFAVVRRTTSLATDPALGGELGPTAIVGEVVRVTGRQGAWTRVRLDDGRDGWVQTAFVISLDAREGAHAASD